eukprot:g12036.t1
MDDQPGGAQVASSGGQPQSGISIGGGGSASSTGGIPGAQTQTLASQTPGAGHQIAANSAQIPIPQMSPQELSQFETLCHSLFNARNESERQNAHKILLPLLDDPLKIPQMQAILMTSSQSHAIIFSTNALMKLITNHWTAVSSGQKAQLKDFMFNQLATRGPAMYSQAHMVVGPFIRLLCRLMKLAWLESPEHQDVVARVNQFFETSTQHCIVGLEVYTELTQDMQPTQGSMMSRYRRTALCFRDTALPSIFQSGVNTLQKLMTQNQLKIENKNEEKVLVKQLLKLIQNCLSFDFMGTMPDDTNEDQQTVMVPHNWAILREDGICNLFFEVYSSCCSFQRMDCSAKALECLVLLASLRRSFFQKEEDRNKLLGHLVQGTSGILASKMGLNDQSCYHAMCRLLGKVNAAHQLSELAAIEVFQMWMQHVYQFTHEGLIDWERQPNSKHYLLQFWSGLVSPMIYLKEKAPNGLETCIQQITIAYIESRIAMAEQAAEQDGLHEWSDPLDEEVLRTEQLEVLSNLSRCRYQDTAQHVMKHFDDTLSRGKNSQIPVAKFEKKMAWLVYMMGSLVAGHSSSGPSSRTRYESANAGGHHGGGPLSPGDPGYVTPPHIINGELAKKVFELINLTDNQPSGNENLESAYLYFLEQFRKVYIGEHAKASAVSSSSSSSSSATTGNASMGSQLAQTLGVADENAILGLLINKIGKNLQHRCQFEQVLSKSLALFHEMAAGINIVHTAERSPHLIVSGRLLLKNAMVQYMMENHCKEEFRFLYHSIAYGKHRTQYYHTLGKLLFMDGRDDMAHTRKLFDGFLKPMAAVLDTVKMLAQQHKLKQEPEAKTRIIGLCRDLRGLCQACNGAESYGLLFSWLVQDASISNSANNRIALFYNALDVFWDDHEVTTPLLKFMAEFCYNKTQRINFEQSSPNGILLFREASQCLTTYGSRILAKDFGDFAPGQSVTPAAVAQSGAPGPIGTTAAPPAAPPRNLYQQKYKGVGVALDLFSHALNGGYCNFGVFELYGDTSLQKSMSLALQMCLCIPPDELKAYPKTCKPFYTFLDLTSKSHVKKVFELQPHQLALLIALVEEGLCSYEVSVSMQCCSIVDNIVSFFVEHKKQGLAQQQEQGLAAVGGGAGVGEQNLVGTQLTPEAQYVHSFLAQQPEALKRILNLMFQLILAGEFSSTWSLSRPLLALILLYPEDYVLLKDRLILQQIEERREKLRNFFEELMQQVENNLSSRNRDHFTRQLYTFAQMLHNFALLALLGFCFESPAVEAALRLGTSEGGAPPEKHPRGGLLAELAHYDPHPDHDHPIGAPLGVVEKVENRKPSSDGQPPFPQTGSLLQKERDLGRGED